MASRTCKNNRCKEKFKPVRFWQKFCSPVCKRLSHAENEFQKINAKALREANKAMKGA